MKRFLSIIIAACGVLVTNAQNGINSPYSRYGFGIQSERAMGFNKGMGGVAQGFRNGQQINTANPASYSAVDSLTALFDIGISLQNGNYKMDDLQQNRRNTSFDYFAFQFRARRKLGMTLALMPITNIKYSFSSSSSPLEGRENVTSSYAFTGDGGLREVFLGAGWNPIKPLSIGVNVGYVWGDYNHKMVMSFSESTAYSMARIYTADISTYDVQAGAQYVFPLNKDDQLTIGATYSLGHGVSSSAFRTTQTLSGTTVQSQTTDTVSHAFQMPHSISAGVTYSHAGRLRVGADFELQKWSDCRFPNQQTNYTENGISTTDTYNATKGQLYDKTKVAAGIDWTPDPTAKKLFRQATYKVGGYYANTYTKADLTGSVTKKPYEFGLSAGVTLPITNRNIWHNSPKINLSVQWIHTNIPYLNTSNMSKSALVENYFKLNIGLTFSERWFYKWKVQ